MEFRLLLWNVEWAAPRSERGRRIRSIVAEHAPDVICLTEASADMLPEGGFAVDARPDYGYGATGARRKVLLWSRTAWDSVDRFGAKVMPGGRFASGIALGMRFVGVCVPWRDAHVRTGRRDRSPWEDHRQYLRGLHGMVPRYVRAPEPLVVLGDFNQRLPRFRQPDDVHAALDGILDEGLVCLTADDQGWGRGQIDHVMVGAGIEVLDVLRLPRVADDGLRLSDHDGLVVRLLAEAVP
jgi:endonuclease/exonuclease/phosphatase family metal-dependent hydrolase